MILVDIIRGGFQIVDKITKLEVIVFVHAGELFVS